MKKGNKYISIILLLILTACSSTNQIAKSWDNLGLGAPENINSSIKEK